MIIEGKNAVTEALDAGVTIEKLCVQKGTFGDSYKRIIAMARKANVKVVFSEKDVLDKLSVSGRHQGVLAVATEYKYFSLDELTSGERGNRLLVLLDGVEDPHNLGAIIRVADCAGADGVVVPKHRGAGVTDTVIKTSAGATAHVKVAKVTNVNDAIRTLKDDGYIVLAADMNGASVYDTNLKGDIAIVIGGEGSGVHALTRKLADGVISLPQFGKVNSLNASVATGILLYEAVRQRTRK